jgi:hypothetical protein
MPVMISVMDVFVSLAQAEPSSDSVWQKVFIPQKERVAP